MFIFTVPPNAAAALCSLLGLPPAPSLLGPPPNNDLSPPLLNLRRFGFCLGDSSPNASLPPSSLSSEYGPCPRLDDRLRGIGVTSSLYVADVG
jgi:hypothetical protein